jgi:uncharacterized protein YjbJ (UPF0337 family)
MDEEPDRLRQDIENTRVSLTRDVDRLAEKTSPKRAAQRRWTAVKDKVMGTSEHARQATSETAHSAVGTVQDKAQDVADSVRSAPQAVALQTQGNPIAAGVIAFGVGMLAATLIPATDAERRAGQQLRDNAGDLTDRMKDVAGEMKDDVSGSVRQAVGQVKETAQDAAQTTKDRAKSSAQDAKERTQQAAQNPR